MPKPVKTPWPQFGGKSRVAKMVWARLGHVDNYIEPFCGSAAVLLARPTEPRVETVNDPAMTLSNFGRATHPERGDAESVAAAVEEVINDADPYLANAWRSIQQAPDITAAWADHPVDESYLHAVHRSLVLGPEAEEFRRRMRTDPDYYDAARAGRWIFGICCWIGGGWCTHHGETADGGRKQTLPNIGQDGKGVTCQPKRRPLIGASNRGSVGKGVNGYGPALKQQVPLIEGHYGSSGRGVHAPSGHRPQLADAYARGRGVHGHDEAGTCERRRAWLCEWFGRLRDRLRPVRVCCGHWLRVCDSESVTTRLGTVGLFLDPPYALDVARMHAWVRHLDGLGPEPEAAGAASNRDGNLYANDRSQDVDRLVAEVHRYARERGALPGYRIALCGYAGEHDALEACGWDVVSWKAQGGYGSRGQKGRANAGRERLWFSPGCLKPATADLFAGVG